MFELGRKKKKRKEIVAVKQVLTLQKLCKYKKSLFD